MKPKWKGCEKFTSQKTIPEQDSLMDALKTELLVLRARIGVSQEALAEKLGISRQTYSGIETGKRKMTWTIFLALVGVFQHNEQTNLILKQMPDFLDDVKAVLNSTKDI